MKISKRESVTFVNSISSRYGLEKHVEFFELQNSQIDSLLKACSSQDEKKISEWRRILSILGVYEYTYIVNDEIKTWFIQKLDLSKLPVPISVCENMHQ